ncbi:hypothetical protein F511_14849 [Dorcoceras hygrometricum]|uniref:Uncharacterized protein n=1 Tax=Dorcoceras hygrometricum TaxID=472368 RepID=A0A2Z7D284_9LAMI|nr:hypothetical protein F511_14849 [Dorcoceras hygrometricum]
MAGRAPAEDVENVVAGLGSYSGKVRLIDGGGGRDYDEPSAATEEIMLLWGIQQPIFSKHNAFVKQSSLQLRIDACGRSLAIHQSPSSLRCENGGMTVAERSERSNSFRWHEAQSISPEEVSMAVPPLFALLIPTQRSMLFARKNTIESPATSSQQMPPRCAPVYMPKLPSVPVHILRNHICIGGYAV